MRVTMDRVGRVVIPKPLREQLGLGPDAEFDAVVDGTAIRLQMRVVDERRIREVDGWPILVAAPGPAVTDDDVRALRDADQR